MTLMIAATLLCAAIFGVSVTLINPEITNRLGFALFYVSLFLTVWGLASIIGFVVRFVFLRKHLAVRAVVISFRQSFIVAFLAVAALLLLANDLFSWLNILLLIVGFSAMEFFLLSLFGEDH